MTATTSVDQLAKQFGNRALAQALIDGQITLADTVARTRSFQYGNTVRQASLKQALQNAARRLSK